MGTWMFIAGSAMFTLAAFLNALRLVTSHLTFTTWAVATCSIYELGGICFVMGSVCFMPNQGCGEGMELMGAWLFIIGSAAYVVGGIIQIMMTVALLHLKRDEAEREVAATRIQRRWRHWASQRRSRPGLLQTFANAMLCRMKGTSWASQQRAHPGLLRTFAEAMWCRITA